MSHLDPMTLELVAKGQGEAPAQEHAKTCPACGQAVVSARGRQRLFAGMKPYTLSDMAFRRVQARLDEAIEQGVAQERAPWWRWLGLGLAVPALALIAFLLTHQDPAPVPNLPLVQRPVAPPSKAPFHVMTTTFAAGDAQLRAGHGAWAPLSAGQTLEADVAVSGSRVIFAAVAPSGGWSFEAKGSVSLGGPATVALGAGTLGATLHGEEAVVTAGSRQIIAHEASFLVSRAAAEVVLDVLEGDVDMSDAVQAQRRSFHAPVRVRWADGTSIAEAQPEATTPTGPFAISVPAQPWAPIDVSELLPKTALSIDGLSYGLTPMSLLLSAGRHRVVVTPPGEVARVAWLDVVGGQRAVLRTPPLMHKDEDVDPAALARVLEDIRRQTPKLRACYEKWLKANPTARGEVSVELTVDAKGHVRHAEVKGELISPESAACLVRTAPTLVLSPLGSEQVLELPLKLTPGK